MREIKFRAWHKEERQIMVEWHNHIHFNGQIYTASGFNCTDKVVLMQFTGLLDKNGKEIYEGDIVSHFGKFRHEVKFKYGSFGYDGQIEEDFISYERNSFNLGLSGDKIEKVEVIGNIYESPELLNN